MNNKQLILFDLDEALTDSRENMKVVGKILIKLILNGVNRE
tara:strand:+ start:324 stop:446 length:123 start_codon:yes stop_codon:yes gene_type:complete